MSATIVNLEMLEISMSKGGGNGVIIGHMKSYPSSLAGSFLHCKPFPSRYSKLGSCEAGLLLARGGHGEPYCPCFMN